MVLVVLTATIAPASDITATAEKITRVLTPALATHRPARTALPQPVMVPVLAAQAGHPGQPRQASAERTSHAS